MVVAKPWVDASLAEQGAKVTSTAFSAMRVVPDGTLTQMRASIDDALSDGHSRTTYHEQRLS